MTLSSVGQTALSGINAATLMLDHVSNNLANAQTNGFKQSFPVFQSQLPQTHSLGSAAHGAFGGTNPRQTGRGVTEAGSAVDLSQGTLQLSNNPSDLALQGNGFFIVQAAGGERFFTRDGRFRLNAAKELVTADGDRVLGFGLDDQQQIDVGELKPLVIDARRPVPTADGGAAFMTAFSIGEDGRVRGHYSDGLTRDLGQLRIARFANPAGLEGKGNNRYAAGVNSGLPVEASPGENGSAEILGGATELSNTDIGQNLIQLTLAQSMFRANHMVLDTGDLLMRELVQLRRS